MVDQKAQYHQARDERGELTSMEIEPGKRFRGKTLTQVIGESSKRLSMGDLADYTPIPTGLERLDHYISGGIRRTELLLLGGPVGVGKTIASLQVARNIASTSNRVVYYVSYEHPEIHLFHRLLCMESINPLLDNELGIGLRDLRKLIDDKVESKRRETDPLTLLAEVLRTNTKAARSLDKMQMYAENLILRKADRDETHLGEIWNSTEELCRIHNKNVVLIIDYLQKVPIKGEPHMNEIDRITAVVEGLKTLAMELEIPVWAVVAADREGLKSQRMHLYHLRGSSALDYECDIAVIMSNKYNVVDKNLFGVTTDVGSFRNWVVLTIEKNRAGMAYQEIEFRLHGAQFVFNPVGRDVIETLIDSRPRG